jgi:hypothetical protein
VLQAISLLSSVADHGEGRPTIVYFSDSCPTILMSFFKTALGPLDCFYRPYRRMTHQVFTICGNNQPAFS